MFSGVLNEIYHQFVVNLFNSGILHLAIHGLFVVSMFVVALGGLVASSSLLAGGRRGALAWSSLIFVSSIWLLTIGSVSYVSTSAGDAAGYFYLLSGALVAAAIVASTLPAVNRLGPIVLSSTLFLVVNGVLIYLFTRNFLLLPFPTLAALAVELVWKKSKTQGFNAALLTGAATGLFSYWLLYPYSFAFFNSGALPSLDVVAPTLGAVAIGVVGAALGMKVANWLSHLARSAPSVRVLG